MMYEKNQSVKLLNLTLCVDQILAWILLIPCMDFEHSLRGFSYR